MKLTTTSVILISLFLFTGCARLCTSKMEKVQITSTTPGATIRFYGDSIGVGAVRYKFNKNKKYQTVSVEKPGFQTYNHAFQTTNVAPTAFLSIIDVPLGVVILGIPFMIGDLAGPKLYRYKPKQVIPALQPLRTKQSDEKYLWVNHAAMVVKSGDATFAQYHNLKSYTNRNKVSDSMDEWGGSAPKPVKEVKGNRDIDISNTIFTDVLNSTLMDMHYVDTVHKVFASPGNSLYLDATIKKVKINRIIAKDFAASSHDGANQLLSAEMDVEWKVLDYYKQPVCTIHTTKTSDLFTVALGKSSKIQTVDDAYNGAIRNAIANNFEYALTDVLVEAGKKDLLKTGAVAADTSAYLLLDKPADGDEHTRLNEILTSSVTIKVDEGHGSGFIISGDGYIVTNYHVIAGTKQVKVTFNNDSTADAAIIKTNPDADLALLKVNRTGLRPLQISATKDQEVGVEVWAIGTPRSVELGQSLSKGIISGIRNANGIAYLQSDAKVSPGNSGGALINRKGDVLGVVSSKLIGAGTEGVSFAIAAYQLFEKLHIRYK